MITRIGGKSSFLRAGDEIIAVDARPVRDQLDLLFHLGERPRFALTIRRDGREHSRAFTRAAFEKARPVYEEMQFARCGSRCIFCFMDQMPRGLRASLYEKDDDYRLSFLFGNFITLNDARERDIARIIELRLSPLYLSVHARERRVRERIFGRPMRRDIGKDMARLARAGITMHAQIVLVPGLNDGAVLDRTVRWLFSLYPACRSVAVVPVGLTAHRAGLPPLHAASAKELRRVIAWAERLRERFRSITGGERFLHLADEFYLATNRTLPPAQSYDDFPQLANGVGMCRHFLAALERDIERARRAGKKGVSLTIATGVLGARFLNRYAIPMIAGRIAGLSIQVMPVRNRLLGPSVTVAGLLSGADILSAARRFTGLEGCLVLPGETVNHEGLLLDGMRPADLARSLGTAVIVAKGTFLERRVLRRCARGGAS